MKKILIMLSLEAECERLPQKLSLNHIEEIIRLEDS